MQAVILAGGKGTRLWPFTTALPKPLVPVGDYPIIAVILRQLRAQGFREVVISTGHLAELIMAYCGDGRRWGLRLRYVREEKPLSTAGALRLVPGLNRDFLVINGDILTTLDFRKLFKAHHRQQATATIAVCERKTVVDFGTIQLDTKNQLRGYVEKPAFRYLVSMGVNILSLRAISRIRRGEFLGIPELIARLMTAHEPVFGFRNRAQWLDIGRPEDYQSAQEIFQDPRRRRGYLRA